ncbi:MAG TPA: carbohydrate kinase family protein [Candidatus Saccharimonadales bacterium]|nr:carbohydrate kinase family protein [Candidatus Saccharimonadales bacterium]
MAKFLQDLLQAKEPLFSTALHHLERAAGHSGVDVRLISDIITRAHHVMRQIGLDPADTTRTELYHALKAHADNESLFTETEFVGLSFNGRLVSFNYDDISANVGKPVDEQETHGMQCALRRELVHRYSQHQRTNDQTVEQFVQDAGLSDICYNQDNHKQKQTERQTDMAQPYILSIGDIVTDAFIKLREDQAEVYTDEHGQERLSMEFGSKPPYDHVDIVDAVGNSANAAVAFARLGLRTSLMGFLGDDKVATESISYLKSENVDTSTMSLSAGMKSNYHYVLRYGADRTILIKYEDYDYKWQPPAETPDWIYLSMISKSAWQLHEDMLEYLNEHPETKLVFQPGTFHFEWGAEKLAKVYERSHIVFMNREEAALVTGKDVTSIPELATALHNLGPKIVVITDGPAGAYASDGEKIIKMPNYPDPVPPYDRTGAGDAFASTTVAVLALGEPLENALRWAPINSMSVVQKLGAQAGLLRRDELEQYLKNAPDDYKLEEIQ